MMERPITEVDPVGGQVAGEDLGVGVGEGQERIEIEGVGGEVGRCVVVGGGTNERHQSV